MTRHLVASLAFAGALILAGCTPAAVPPPPPAAPAADAPEDIAALNAARAAFMAAYEKGDADAIGRLYHPEAVSEPNNQPTLKGREAIVASLKSMFEQVSVKVVLTPGRNQDARQRGPGPRPVHRDGHAESRRAAHLVGRDATWWCS